MAGPSDMGEREAMGASAGTRLALIAESFERLAGRALVERGADGLERALWEAPRVIVAHGTEARPLFFYGNRAALALFEMRASQFIGLPSERSAEPEERDERARMFAALERHDVIDDYAGVRIAASGRRFEITRAHVWNLRDREGHRHGQAATFARWRFL
jgi:hypothetical protein